CGVVGALIVTTHRTHPIGWMFCGAAVSFGFSFFAREYAIQALVVAPGTLPFGEAMAWFGFWADMPGIAVVALFLPLLFPDGHLPSPRWKPAAYFAGLNVALAVTALPVAVGVAILRYRLYDIDLIINRTLVYVLLTAILAGVYTAVVALFQRTFVAISGQGSDLAIVMTLFVLATVFTPIKN